ncbi:MAG: hypothetical protein AB7Y46_03840 [Armatimonadota bacterium]
MVRILIIVLSFAIAGGLMAFLIQYEEMRHHLDHRAALLAAAEAGAVASGTLAALSLVAARLLGVWP